MGSKQNPTAGYLVNERYKIVRCIGAGSFGQVYHARDLHLDKQDIALKLLHAHLVTEKVVLKRFHNEVFISRKLIHPNIVRVYDFESWERGHLLSLEYVSGCDLSEISVGYAHRRLPYEEAVYIVSQVAAGLACAHKNDVIHRDLKPHNILLDRSGVARITDFGLAFSLESSHALTQTGEVIGSPAYLAPEQFTASTANKLSDIYSLGVIFFELLVGELPFQSSTYYGLGEAHRVAVFPREKLEALEIPTTLREIICACCEKEPANRPSGAEELVSALDSSRGESMNELAEGLKTMVHYRRKDVRIFHSSSLVNFFSTAAVLVLLFLSYIVLQDENPQSRMLTDLHKIEKVTGHSTKTLRELIPTNVEIDVGDDEELKTLIEKDRSVTLEIMLNAGKDLLRTFNDGSGDTLVHYAARVPVQHHTGLLQKARVQGILSMPNKRGDTPVHAAIKAGNTGGLRLLINVFGARLGDFDGDGNTPLHLATASGSLESVKMILYSGQLLSRERQNHEGLNVLHLAVRAENVKILQVLLDSGIQVDLRDARGLTPLMRAVLLKQGPRSKKMILTLLSRGASLEARANDGRSVYEFAEDAGRLEEFKQYLSERDSPRTAKSGTGF